MFRDGEQTRIRVAQLGAAQGVWSTVVALLWIGGMMTLTADQDYTSGELLDHLLAWMNGEPLYPNAQAPPYRVLNYPPLGLAIVRAISWAGVTPLLAGRLFGTLGIIAALWVLYAWLREVGIEQLVARITIALAGLSFPLLYSSGQFHLEGWAVALTMSGVRFVARATRTGQRREYAVAGFFMATACFVKQTQLFVLLLVVIWMLRYARPAAVVFVLAAAIAAIAGAGIMQFYFGTDVWTHVITYTVGTYSLGNLAIQLASHALPFMPFAVVGWYHSFSTLQREKDIRQWYLVGTTLLLLTAARVGSGFQYFLEWHLVVLLSFAPALQSVVNRRGRDSGLSSATQLPHTAAHLPHTAAHLSHTATHLPHTATHLTHTATHPPHTATKRSDTERRLCSAVVAVVVATNFAVPSLLYYNWHLARNTQYAFATLCPLVPKAPALLPTENPGAARACGARALLHPFIIASLTARGLWNEDLLVHDLADGRYSALLLPFNPALPVGGVHRERWSPRVLDAMRTSYHPLQHENGWWLLAPVRGAPAPREFTK